jgi:hypothetical protein
MLPGAINVDGVDRTTAPVVGEAVTSFAVPVTEVTAEVGSAWYVGATPAPLDVNTYVAVPADVVTKRVPSKYTTPSVVAKLEALVQQRNARGKSITGGSNLNTSNVIFKIYESIQCDWR